MGSRWEEPRTREQVADLTALLLRLARTDEKSMAHTPTCPQCSEDGITPARILRDGEATSTSLMVEEFWDANGTHHHHDPNLTREKFLCSEGHRGSEVNHHHTQCGCGWEPNRPATESDIRRPAGWV